MCSSSKQDGQNDRRDNEKSPVNPGRDSPSVQHVGATALSTRTEISAPPAAAASNPAPDHKETAALASTAPAVSLHYIDAPDGVCHVTALPKPVSNWEDLPFDNIAFASEGDRVGMWLQANFAPDWDVRTNHIERFPKTYHKLLRYPEYQSIALLAAQISNVCSTLEKVCEGGRWKDALGRTLCLCSHKDEPAVITGLKELGDYVKRMSRMFPESPPQIETQKVCSYLVSHLEPVQIEALLAQGRKEKGWRVREERENVEALMRLYVAGVAGRLSGVSRTEDSDSVENDQLGSANEGDSGVRDVPRRPGPNSWREAMLPFWNDYAKHGRKNTASPLLNDLYVTVLLGAKLERFDYPGLVRVVGDKKASLMPLLEAAEQEVDEGKIREWQKSTLFASSEAAREAGQFIDLAPLLPVLATFYGFMVE